jgi:hypothetical protein
MTTVADLPDGARLQTAPGAWRYNYGVDNLEHWLTWHVAFENLQEFWNKVLYTATSIPVGLGSITRIASLVCPMDKRAVALDIQGGNFTTNRTSDPAGPWEEEAGIWTPNQDHPPFPVAVATVHFGVPKYQVDGDRPYMDVSEESTAERRTIPNYAYELIDESGTVIERLTQDVAIPAGTSRYRLTWHELSLTELAVAQSIFEPLKDKVNDDTVTIPFVEVTCEPGTLHMLSKSANVTLGFGGNTKATLSAELNHFPGGWNRFIASVSPFRGVLLRANPRPIAEADFSTLFDY